MEQTQPAPKRPLFLTIICILSYAGLGLAIFNKLMGAIVFKTILFPIEHIQSEINNAIMDEDLPYGMQEFIFKIKDDIFELIDKLPIIMLIGALFAIVALIGVINIWQLKKTGFYLYLSGRILMVLTPIFVCGGNFIAGLASLSDGFFAAVFITLYAVNYRHLK